jgi:hypothetical protein
MEQLIKDCFSRDGKEKICMRKFRSRRPKGLRTFTCSPQVLIAKQPIGPGNCLLFQHQPDFPRSTHPKYSTFLLCSWTRLAQEKGERSRIGAAIHNRYVETALIEEAWRAGANEVNHIDTLLEAEEDMKELVCDCGGGDDQYRQYFMLTVAVFTDAARRERQVHSYFSFSPLHPLDLRINIC